MAGRTYPRLSIEEFGEQLLTSGDLDPIYIALVKCDWADLQLKRWLIAYWCFYHAGFACWASEFGGNDFWKALMIAAVNEEPCPNGLPGRWPRGHERRHFRAKIAVTAVESYQKRYGNQPEKMVNYLMGNTLKPQPYKTVAARVKEHSAFGPWMAFKVADMLERVMGVHVDFDRAAVFMFDDPVRAAFMLYEQRNPPPEGLTQRLKKEAVIEAVVKYLTWHFRKHEAPPRGGKFVRPVGLQEVETILCKWKSHMNGHYPINNDLVEISQGVENWSKCCQSAIEFRQAMPRWI